MTTTSEVRLPCEQSLFPLEGGWAGKETLPAASRFFDPPLIRKKTDDSVRFRTCLTSFRVVRMSNAESWWHFTRPRCVVKKKHACVWSTDYISTDQFVCNPFARCWAIPKRPIAPLRHVCRRCLHVTQNFRQLHIFFNGSDCAKRTRIERVQWDKKIGFSTPLPQIGSNLCLELFRFDLFIWWRTPKVRKCEVAVDRHAMLITTAFTVKKIPLYRQENDT